MNEICESVYILLYLLNVEDISIGIGVVIRIALAIDFSPLKLHWIDLLLPVLFLQ